MKKIFSFLLSFILIFSVFSGCSVQNDDNNVDNENAYDVIEAVYPINTTVDLHSAKQAKFLSSSPSSVWMYAHGTRSLCSPKSVSFAWTYNGAVSDSLEFTLNISENEDMQNAVSYTTASESISVYNLKIDTTYYWNVSANGTTSSVAEFTTDSQPPRNIHVDGVKNVRDLGGWQTENGKRTKQGLIFRCGRLNESSAAVPNIEVTDDGIKTMCEQLGIKSEIDLRKTRDNEIGAISSSPLGDGVTYYACPMEWEGDMFNGNKEEILKVFEILSDYNNYPVIFHCNIGTDRTGMIAYLVNALLGVSEEDLFKDYLFSNFADIGGPRSVSKIKSSVYYQSVQEAEGDTLSEKAYNCLVDFGVPADQLDSVISILSDD